MIGKLESGIPHSCKEIDSLIQDLEYPHRLNKEKAIQKLEKIRKINYDLRIFAERMADRVEQLEEKHVRKD